MRLFLLSLLAMLSLPGIAAKKTAIFAGGCFWCVEADFDKVPGVLFTVSGFDGGKEERPSYKLVSSGTTDYVESVQVVYDNSKVNYTELLDYFLHHIDPTDKNGQFCDKGKQYRSVIFYLDDTQKNQASAAIEKIKKELPAVYTEILPSTNFFPAETYHQNYHIKHAWRYKYYRYRCGRDARVKEVWSHVKD